MECGSVCLNSTVGRPVEEEGVPFLAEQGAEIVVKNSNPANSRVRIATTGGISCYELSRGDWI
jgi:hypothetical protein